MVKRKPEIPDDSTEEIPRYGITWLDRWYNRIERGSITLAILFAFAWGCSRAGAWSADHVFDPIVRSDVEQRMALTTAVKSMASNQDQLREAVKQLAFAMQTHHEDNMMMQRKSEETNRVLSELVKEIHNNRKAAE